MDDKPTAPKKDKAAKGSAFVEKKPAAKAPKAATSNGSKRLVQKGRRTWLFTFECVAAAIFLVLALAGVFVWRLYSGPLDISFAKDYIEDALNGENAQQVVRISSARLHWPDLDGPLFLGLEQLRIDAADGRELLGVEELALALSKRKLFLGKLAPEIAVLRKSTLHIVRTADGALDFGVKQNTAPDEEELVTAPKSFSGINIDDVRGQVAVALDTLSANKNLSPILSQFQGLQIENASVVVEDFTTNASWFFPDFDATFIAQGESLQLRGGLSVKGFDIEATDNPDLRVNIDAFYDAEKKSLNAELSSKNVSSDLINLFSMGTPYDVDFKSDVTLSLHSEDYLKDLSLTLAFASEGGTLALPDYYDAPLALKDIQIKLTYDDENAKFVIDDSGLVLDDIPIKLSGEFMVDKGALEVVPEEAEELPSEEMLEAMSDAVAAIAPEPVKSEVIRGQVGFTIPTLKQSRLDEFWPKSLKNVNAYKWMVQRLSKGTFKDLRGEVILSATRNFNAGGNEGASVTFENFKGGYDFEGLTIDYRSPMVPISDAAGTGVLDLKAETLGINLTKGSLVTGAGTLAISKADLGIAHVMTKGGSKADLSITMNGPVASALDFITKEPLGVEHKFKDVLKSVKGSSQINLGLKFPATAGLLVEDINVDLSGTMSDVRLPSVVQELDLTGGPFNVEVNNERVQVKGSGQLDGRPIKLTWMNFISSEGKPHISRVDASLDADPNLRKKMGIDLDGFLEGTVPLKVTYFKRHKNAADIDIEADLNKSRVFVSPVGFEKPVGARGFATLKAYLKNDKLQSLKNISVSSTTLKMDNGSLLFAGDSVLKSGKIPSFQVGKSVGGLTFDIAPKTELTTIDITARTFDISAFVGSGDDVSAAPDAAAAPAEELPYDKPPMKITITADQMTAGGAMDVEGGKVFADIDGTGRFNDLSFDGFAGGAEMFLRYAPNAEGVQTFEMRAEDAGAAMQAFDLYDNIRGGVLEIYAEPVGWLRDRNLKGKARISGFTAVNTPVLARLLGSLSRSDLNEVVKGKGIPFKRLEADFDWVYHPFGSKLVLKDGRTSGNSLGLTFKGDYDSRASKIDVSGTIVPLSGVNKAISSIPVIGQVLSGGTGSVFAATYTIKGDGKDPAVVVNPLSVLAPGLIRRILFEKN